MTKRILTLLWAVLLPMVGCGDEIPPIDQPGSKREISHAVLGEDGSSAYYYFFYTLSGEDEVSKVRIVWNGGAQNPPTVTDYYFDGSAVLVIERSAERKSLPKLLKGQDAPFQPVREFRFRSENEDMLIGAGEVGRLSKEERLALSVLMHALSLKRKPLPAKAK